MNDQPTSPLSNDPEAFNDATVAAALRAGDSLDRDLAIDSASRLVSGTDTALDEAADVTALVASFRAVRAALADAPPAPANARETAIRAALAAFDDVAGDAVADASVAGDDNRQPAPVAAGETWAPVRSLDQHRQRRMQRIAVAAASVMVLGGLGIFAASRAGSSDSAAGAAVSGDAEMSRTATETFDTGGVPHSPELAPDTTTAVAASDTVEGPLGGGINGPADVRVVLATADEFSEWVQQRNLERTDKGDLFPGCGVATSSADVDYGGGDVVAYLDVGGAPAVAVRSADGSRVAAIDEVTCAVLQEVDTP
jgi:hypothetical protein